MAERHCKICEHPQRPLIDGALLLGKPFRSIAAEFGVRLSTLGRHALHSRTATERAAAKITASYARSLHCCLRDAQNEVMMVLKSARQSGDSALALQAARELREIIESGRKLLARATDQRGKAKPAEGELAPEVVERILKTREANNEPN